MWRYSASTLNVPERSVHVLTFDVFGSTVAGFVVNKSAEPALDRVGIGGAETGWGREGIGGAAGAEGRDGITGAGTFPFSNDDLRGGTLPESKEERASGLDAIGGGATS